MMYCHHLILTLTTQLAVLPSGVVAVIVADLQKMHRRVNVTLPFSSTVISFGLEDVQVTSSSDAMSVTALRPLLE